MTASPQDHATEAQLAAALARCAAGERPALRVIYDVEAGRMVGVARRILKRQDLAEEAVQDTFMRVWRAAGTFDPQKGAAIFAQGKDLCLAPANGRSWTLRDIAVGDPEQTYARGGEHKNR